MTKPRIPRKNKNMLSNPNQIDLSILREATLAVLDRIDKIQNEGENKDALTHNKFIVFNKQLKAYTTVIATNIHHAGNKATKLFKGHYTGIIEGDYETYASLRRGYTFLSVADFNLAIKET